MELFRARWVAALLFLSGCCALIYQVTWLRELRLIFGASTAASATVLAVFVGGLGLGSRFLGPRADRQRSGLRFYGLLEAGIAVGAAVSPLLVLIAHRSYVALGGTLALGSVFGTLLRLVLSALVLGLPTVLMGGTLPAASRAVVSDADGSRRNVALLYGANTLGAVAGSFLATFVLLESLGNRWTLWLAAGLNLVVAFVAYRAGARSSDPAPEATTPAVHPATVGALPSARFPLVAAALVGFAFFLMELVWYRMLAPLLGGSVFTFGLILSVALLGIGIGGALFSRTAGQLVSLRTFAVTCMLEAAALAVPFALGDRIALLALVLRPYGALGFWVHVLSWSFVTAIVVLPAAIVAGYQFPVLIALLGRGRDHVGRHVGLAYAWNTVGAILGSLAGGFGLLPLLGAVDCWRGVAGGLAILGMAAVLVSLRQEGQFRPVLPLALAVVAALFLVSPGPSAAWRHSGIGAGRARVPDPFSSSAIQDWLNAERRAVMWERDGLESSVALRRLWGVAFVINGKVDGHATVDAPTQVVSGLLASFLHDSPRTAAVIGLGTGSTGGWLAAVPEIERVDIVELEPVTRVVAQALAAVNKDVLHNPKAHLIYGDAREVLLTMPDRYDLIFSEPSNPYRAGIASLFTQEFYRAVDTRLAPDGIFVQWVQGYEIDVASLRSVYRTLSTVFPVVESWRTHRDLLLVASRQPRLLDEGVLRERLRREPYAEGFRIGWNAVDLEGVLARFVAGPDVARDLALAPATGLNRDDRNPLEFGFARSVGRSGLFDLSELWSLARRARRDRPGMKSEAGGIDWARVDEEQAILYGGGPVADATGLDKERRARVWAFTHWANGRLDEALRTWRTQPAPPRTPAELVLVAEGLAEEASDDSIDVIRALGRVSPADAFAILARLRLRQGLPDQAVAALLSAYDVYHRDPWAVASVMYRSFDTALQAASGAEGRAASLFGSLGYPFAGLALGPEREYARFKLSAHMASPEACVEALQPFEPHVPWNEQFLTQRFECYQRAGSPRAASAARDLGRLRASLPEPLLADSLR